MIKGEKLITKMKTSEVRGGTQTRLSASIFISLIAVAIIATILYGGVDMISGGLLAVAAGVIFCMWIADSWKTGKFRFSSSPLQIPFVLLIVLGAIQLLPLGDSGVAEGALTIAPSNALTVDPFATRLFVVKLICYLVFFAAALVYIDTPRRANRLAIAVILFGSLIAFFGVLQRLADPEAIYGIRPTPQAIPFGPFINQHHFAGFMEMTSGLVFGLLLGGGVKRDRKAFLLIAAILMTTALMFTGSRGGVISFAGVFIFAVGASYLLHGGRNREARSEARNFSVLVAGAGLALLIVGLVFYLGGADSMFRAFGLQQMQTDVTSGRMHFWRVAFEIFKAHPVIGAGLEAFGNAFTRYDTSSGAFRIEQAHNDYLQMLADGGVTGFLCVTAFVVLLFRKGIRNVSSTRDELARSIAIGSLAGCFGILIHSFFDFPLRTPSNALFFLLLAVLGTVSFGRKET
jgi:O-antigen ligase